MVVKKAKSKDWYNILAPDFFNKKEIGKTLASESKLLLGRKIAVSAVQLTNDFNKYYLKLIFKITQVNGKNALTEFYGSECLRDYISRLVVRRVRRIDTVQDLITKDGRKIRVKTITVIPRRANSSIQKSIAKKIRELVGEIVSNSTLEEFAKNLLGDEVKNKIIKEARKIYPIRHFEFRKTEVF